MQNEPQKKPKETISFSNLPNIIVVVTFIVGIGAVFGLLGYLVCGIKENVTPVTQKPSVEITGDYFGNDFIQVKSPQKNATIKNPVLISGKANVDEANVRVKVTDDNENILADTFITADGWMDKLYPFEKEISYGTPQTENGLIEIFEESARDGSEIYKIEVLVVFEDYEDAFSDWEVYRREKYGFEFEYPENCFLKEPFDGRIYLKSEVDSYLFGRIISISVGEKIPINGKSSFSDVSKMSFEEFISKNIKSGCAASRAGGGISSEIHCIDEVEIEPFLNTKGATGYKVYITEITETSTVEKTTTEKRKKGPIFAFNISDQTYNKCVLFQLEDETEKNSEKEMHSKILDQILSTFKFIEK